MQQIYTRKDALEKKRKQSAERRQKMRQAGICYHCGKVPSTTGKCDGCKQKQNSRRDRKRCAESFKLWRQKRKEQGLCERCGDKAIPGKTLCEYHRQLRWQHNNRAKIAACIVSDADYVPASKAVPVVIDAGKPPWFLSFNCETTPTVFEMGVGQ